MKPLLFLIASIASASASPMYVTTVISDKEWRTSILGAASPDVYVSQFMGEPGVEVDEFGVIEEPHGDDPSCWILWAEIDTPDGEQFKPAAVPEAGTFGLLTIGMVGFMLLMRVMNESRNQSA